MVSVSSIIIGLGGAAGGAIGVGGYLFLKGYLQQAGANAANKTPVIKADTVNKGKKEGNQNVLEKLEQLREEKSKMRRKKETEIEDFKQEISDYERIIESIQDDGVARKRLIENYWKPLHALVACFTKSKVDTDEGETNFVLEALRRGRNVEQITGSAYIVPPKDVPSQIKSNPDSRAALESWIEDEVYADHPDALAHIAMFGLVDLRNVYSSSDYEEDDLPHFFSTVDWEFDLEDIFDSEDFSRLLANESVNLTEIIENGDIAFFVSKSVSPEELDEIHEAQTNIEDELGNPDVKQLADNVSLEELFGVLAPYVSDPQSVAESVKDEARIWKEQLYS
jgi:DNA-binding protein H-NS